MTNPQIIDVVLETEHQDINMEAKHVLNISRKVKNETFGKKWSLLFQTVNGYILLSCIVFI